MNKHLIALSLIGILSLAAKVTAEEINIEQTGTCDSCSCDTCSCDTCSCDNCYNDTCSCTTCCCEPEPKKCIDCECYTPQFYDLQCDCGFFFSGEFLYWYARETNLPFAARLVPQASNSDTAEGLAVGYINKFEHFDTKWDPGLRVGVGYNSGCDGWDYYLNWTYFHNSEKEALKISPDATANALFLNPWKNSAINGSLSLGGLHFSIFNTISAKWKTRFNQIDLEIGRKYWLSRCFTLRPYAGIRGAWTRTVFSEKGTLESSQFNISQDEFSQSTDRFKNRLWGVGFLTGMQPNWYFCRNFILYANLDAALLWGELESKKNESLFISGIDEEKLFVILNPSNTSNDSFFTMSALIDLGIGLRWEETWCCDQYRTSLDLGWEHHIWFDHGYYYKTQGSGALKNTEDTITLLEPTSYSYDMSNLIYGGLVVRLRFDF